jgi:hypothetical protein
VSGKLAIVFCVHHKPWLMMSTLLTLVSQEREPADLFFAYNVGGGDDRRESYREYRDVAARAGVNPQLSPFDERVREVCRLRGWTVAELEYDNDHALDSGCWYKFIRDGLWRDYERVLFLHEGMLLANPRLLRALVAFSDRRGAHFIASGHEKRRVPKAAMRPRSSGDPAATPMDDFHRRMMAETFAVFCRDPEFQRVYERWDAASPVETEHHVPGVTTGGVRTRRLRARIQKQWGSAYTHPDAPWTGRLIRQVPAFADRWTSRMGMMLGPREPAADLPLAYVAGSYDVCAIGGANEIVSEGGVTFHRVEAPEWFGCATNHLLSRAFLERFSERLHRFGMFDVLNLPFAGSALEVIWGFLPAWLGVDKWFANGFHRVRKQFSTYQREDYPPEMAGYINRYHRGRLVVGWHDDYLRLEAWRPDLGDLRQVLPAVYF